MKAHNERPLDRYQISHIFLGPITSSSSMKSTRSIRWLENEHQLDRQENEEGGGGGEIEGCPLACCSNLCLSVPNAVALAKQVTCCESGEQTEAHLPTR